MAASTVRKTNGQGKKTNGKTRFVKARVDQNGYIHATIYPERKKTTKKGS